MLRQNNDINRLSPANNQTSVESRPSVMNGGSEASNSRSNVRIVRVINVQGGYWRGESMRSYRRLTCAGMNPLGKVQLHLPSNHSV